MALKVREVGRNGTSNGLQEVDGAQRPASKSRRRDAHPVRIRALKSRTIVLGVGLFTNPPDWASIHLVKLDGVSEPTTVEVEAGCRFVFDIADRIEPVWN